MWSPHSVSNKSSRNMVLSAVARKTKRCWVNYKTRIKVLMGVLALLWIHMTFNKEVDYIFINENTDKKCEIPNLDSHEKSIAKFLYHLKPIQCEISSDFVFIDSFGFLRVNDTAVLRSGHTNVSCTYSIVKRSGDYDIETEAEVHFSNAVYVNADFFLVKCRNKRKTVVYKKLHHTIDYKSRMQQSQFLNESKEHLNVYVFGLDSLSRLAAERTIPLTLRYLQQDLGGYIMKGYTKVGANTFPNLISFLTGKVSYSNELPPYTEILDPYPFIWKNFSNSGYASFFAEDLPEMGTFTYWKGFKEQPCLHYMRPFYLAMDKLGLPNTNQALLTLENNNIHLGQRSALCVGNTPKHKMMMNYYKQFIEMYGNKRKFALSWLNELTHQFDNLVQLADRDIMLFFKWLKESGRLANSILILMSDHGIMQKAIKNTLAGRTENRMPLFAIVIPPSMKSKYPHIHDNLQTNTQRLTSAFDAHETLVDVLESNFVRSMDSVNEGKKLPRGISLFREIPERRSCKEADIPGDYCVCNSYEILNKNDKISEDLAQFLVSYINHNLSKHRGKCSRLYLLNIVDTYLVKSNLRRRKDDEQFSIRNLVFEPDPEEETYLCVFETVPGHAIFEATARSNNKGSYDVIGRVNRMNKYGNQSFCIQDKFSKPLCYCGETH
ncbi:uncharacterized protein LOC125667497 isoform X2 [Ostrea edulis]|uniref:uncharacterized protein LOC125667497 isoform X2 n=1 Tax=Ostrea edulis TaxID=37623 RepID=UPI0024AFEFE5|nr:uncharacterized protein LOC125667497 isoform X2 [Ostrea edulis]